MAALVLCTPASGERPAQTGTHLDSRVARPFALQISESSEVHEIQGLLTAGNTDEAVARARAYVDSFRRMLRVSFDESLPARYFALNALCVALTQQGEAEEAANTCSEAIELIPDRWSAINNRGTARFVAGRYGEALADYRLALRVAPQEPPIVSTLEHNIALSVQYQRERRLSEPGP